MGVLVPEMGKDCRSRKKYNVLFSYYICIRIYGKVRGFLLLTDFDYWMLSHGEGRPMGCLGMVTAKCFVFLIEVLGAGGIEGNGKLRETTE